MRASRKAFWFALDMVAKMEAAGKVGAGVAVNGLPAAVDWILKDAV